VRPSGSARVAIRYCAEVRSAGASRVSVDAKVPPVRQEHQRQNRDGEWGDFDEPVQ